MKNKKEKIDFEKLDNPEDLELKDKIKKFSKILGYYWGFCFIILIIVPLLDFSLNQFFVYIAYYSILFGLLYFLALEFWFENLFKLLKKILKK